MTKAWIEKEQCLKKNISRNGICLEKGNSVLKKYHLLGKKYGAIKFGLSLLILRGYFLNTRIGINMTCDRKRHPECWMLLIRL